MLQAALGQLNTKHAVQLYSEVQVAKRQMVLMNFVIVNLGQLGAVYSSCLYTYISGCVYKLDSLSLPYFSYRI